ncbi:MAG: hypothetical protein IJ836_05395 [Spirochaetales bacterium]|nr:hypothetical protein [Spirochaetales bacterium]
MWASVSVLVESQFCESLSDTQMSQVHRIDIVHMHPAATSGACPIITVCELSMDEVDLSACLGPSCFCLCIGKSFHVEGIVI